MKKCNFIWWLILSNIQHFMMPCAKLKSNIKKWNFVIGVLRQVPLLYFFENQSTLVCICPIIPPPCRITVLLSDNSITNLKTKTIFSPTVQCTLPDKFGRYRSTVCDWWRYCKVQLDEKFGKIDGKGRTFSHIAIQ